MAAFQESDFRCNIEFLRSSKPGIGRVIRFNHSPEAVPQQLANRVTLGTWQVRKIKERTPRGVYSEKETQTDRERKAGEGKRAEEDKMRRR